MTKLGTALLIVGAMSACNTDFEPSAKPKSEVYVRDADTIVLDGLPVRLNGVDAPELRTQAGQSGKRWMQNYVKGKNITCDLNGERSYDRVIGICYADGQDIGASVIAAGHALDCARYSGGRYRNFETEQARAQNRRANYC